MSQLFQRIFMACLFVGGTSFLAQAESAKPEADTAHQVTKDHQHEHNDKCGHKAVKHADHVDYVHDGHYHAKHGDHVDEHGVIAAK